MKKICLTVFFVVVLGWALQPAVHAQSSDSQQTLNKYLSDLRKNPNDYALREQIIKLVQTMKPAPAIAEEARKHFVEGGVLLKGAADKKDYELAVTEYKQALLVAPGVSDAYYKPSPALAADGQYDDAINALKLYLETGPKDAREAQDKIYEIDASKKLAEKRALAAREEGQRRRIEEQRRVEEVKGLIDDQGAGLQWVCAPNQDMTWYQADAYAKNLSIAGGSWRLPTRAELRSLNQRIGSLGGFDKFGVRNVGVWSSEGEGQFAWELYFGGQGQENPLYRGNYYKDQRVLAVRSTR